MLYEYLKERMGKFPDKTLREGDVCVTYKELLECPPALLKGLKYRDKVAVNCKSPLNTARGIFACLKAGVIAVPLSYQYGQAHIDKLRDRIRLGCAITDDDGELKVTFDKDKLTGSADWENIATAAFILCTSGTSGKPKGVVLTKKGIAANLDGIESYFHINETDKILIARPLYHCAVLIGEFLTSLCRGLDIEFMDGFDPAGIIERIQSGGVTVLGGTPTTFYHLCNTAKKLSTVTGSHKGLPLHPIESPPPTRKTTARKRCFSTLRGAPAAQACAAFRRYASSIRNSEFGIRN